MRARTPPHSSNRPVAAGSASAHEGECEDGLAAVPALKAQLCASVRYARELLDASPDPMLVVDMQRRITDANPAAEEITGLPRNKLVGSDLLSCFTHGEQISELVLRALIEGKIKDQPLAVRHQTGRQTEVLCCVSIHRNENNKAIGVFIAARDVTELRQYETQMSFQATCDALTALPNRLLFRERLARAMKRADARTGCADLMFIDLDNFKDINDTLGHGVGDELLKKTAIRLVDALEMSDTIARMGGDEFAVLIDDTSCTQGMEQLALRLREIIARPHVIDGHEVAVSCSIGITRYPADGGDVDTLLRNADAAMYRAKEDGKNAFRHFSAEMNDAIRRRVDISNSLRRAIGSAEFSLHYQPRAEMGEGKMCGVEALLRWHSSELGIVSPAEFIPVAESNGLIVQIGEWVLHQACRQAMQWLQATGLPVSIAVNLSARQFRDTDIARAVTCALECTGLAPHLLELELTESMLMHDVKRVLRTLYALKDIGVRLAVDDFGTGYSSLSYLKSFPLDYLKVDRSFIQDVPHNQSDRAIVRAIIGMAHSLGIKVIAEGVETAEQLAFLLEQRCDEVQGYFFCRPVPAAEFEALIHSALRIDPVHLRRAGINRSQTPVERNS